MRVSKAAPSKTTYQRLQREVIRPGLCTHCGTCAGLSRGALSMHQGPHGPLPSPTGRGQVELPPYVLEACPGRSIDYPALYKSTFDALPENWLLGPFRRTYRGYPASEDSGMITSILLHLLETGQIEGVIAVRQGTPQPWEAAPVIATTPEELRACSGSVSHPVPVNTILAQVAEFEGRLAYVGLPDQVASIRALQALGHPAANKIALIVGPFSGISVSFAAVLRLLRSRGVRRLDQVSALRYSSGQWPAEIEITLKDGRVLQAGKRAYHATLPFYYSRGSLFSVDYANELTDISVGVARIPASAPAGRRASLVVARSERGEALIDAMCAGGLLRLEGISPDEALALHGHMLEFKKLGAFARIGWRRALGRRAPDYGYRPARISLRRRLVELLLGGLLTLSGSWVARRMVDLLPLWIISPALDGMRTRWQTRSEGRGAAPYPVHPISRKRR